MSDWLDLGRRAAKNREAFAHHHHELPGRIRQLLKHLDPRTKSQRNVERELAELGEAERSLVDSLLKYQQSFAPDHRFEKPRHESKYKGKARNNNHLVSREELSRWDKRGA